MTARGGFHQPTRINKCNCCACLTNTDKTCENGSRTIEWFFNSNMDLETDCREWLTWLDTTKWLTGRTYIFRVQYNPNLILAVPMRECFGEHLCMSSPFPIAILNGNLFFRKKTWSKWSESRLSKADYNNNSIIFCCGGWVIIFAVMFI